MSLCCFVKLIFDYVGITLNEDRAVLLKFAENQSYEWDDYKTFDIWIEKSFPFFSAYVNIFW